MTTATPAPVSPARPSVGNEPTLSKRVFRILSIVRLDLAAALRRPMWWTWIGLIALMALVLSQNALLMLPQGDSAVGGKQTWVTSEFAVACDTVILAILFHAFFITIIAGLTVIRDEEQQVGEILHATPLTPGEYIWGKFLAVLAAIFLALIAQYALFAVSNHLYPHNGTPELHGPFAIGNYLRPAIEFAVPQFLFLGGVSFMIGERSRRPILVFVLPAAILLLSVFVLGHESDSRLTSPLARHLQMWCDPTGLAWLRRTWFDVDRGADFYNHHRVILDSAFLTSRLVFSALGLGAVAFSQAKFAGTLRRSARSGRKPRARRARPAPAAWRPVEASKVVTAPLARLRMQSGTPRWLASALAVASIEARELWTQPGLYLFIPLIVLFTTTSSLDATGMLDTPLLLTAGTLAERQFSSITVFLALILIVYTVESLERERACRFLAIRNSLPISTSGMLLGKFLTLNCVALAVAGSCLLVDLVILMRQGHVPVVVWPFALLWGVLGWPTVWMVIAGTMAAYSVTRSRAGAYVLGLCALILYTVPGADLSWAGNLALADAVHWSDLSVLEMDRHGLILNRLIALGAVFFYGAVAVRYFPRRERDPVQWATAMRPGPIFRSAALMLLFALPAFVGTFVLFQNVVRGQGGSVVADAEKNYWKKNINTWRDASMPGVRAADLSVDIYPDSRSFRVRGSYQLFNKDSKPLAHIPMTCGFQWKHLHWTLDGKPYQPTNLSGVYVITPDPALPPGKSALLGFSYDAPDPGISKGGKGLTEFVLPSAVVLTSFSTRFVPRIGYDPEIGVNDDNESDPADLSVTGIPESHGPLFGAPTPFMLSMRVTAPADFAVNCVGDKVGDQVQGDRRTTVWRSAHPVSDFNIVGGRWAVRRVPGVAVFYHPGHGENVGDMLSALAEARRKYSAWYAPYPDRELKLSEYPALAGLAQSFPTNITFGEEMGFLTQTDDDANAPFAVTAHEAAHQWWGTMVVPGDAPGGNVISEGMAQFSAVMLIDAVKGDAARQAFLREMESEYFKGRSVDSELSLAWTDGSKSGDQAVTYDKGGWAFYMLAQQMGWANAQRGFQKFLATYRHSDKTPTLTNLTDTLREFAPDKTGFDDAVQLWLHQTDIPEYQLSDVHRSRMRDGRWLATAQVKNIGGGRPVVEVGAWIEKSGSTQAQWRLGPMTPGEDSTGNYKYVGPGKPTRIVVDPNVKTLQRNRENATYRF
ncbi:hypothetical protein CCAX7_24050 [Capsulimonas corticalis]|uniref:Uncharacterized protein n=1 Tax=Capsulimonas corticalis TaxID=2219043 RepID=A0A402CVC4_9BACT|nr:M1 family aminopeptidase [Capsulimonas corticalis]BDI30354.1 hypothetical protein CCAX7_24050 [Capsulimonas corticalis]